MKKKSNPWLKFYPSDWLGDPNLRLCSPLARALWIDCLCLMHAAEPYGHLLVAGEPVSVEDLASIARVSPRQAAGAIDELRRRGVCSVTEEGVIYSRRMVRDAELAEQGRAHIAKRWGTSPATDPPTRPNGHDTARDPNRVPKRGATPKPITQIPDTRGKRVEGEDARARERDRDPLHPSTAQRLIAAIDHPHLCEQRAHGLILRSAIVEHWIRDGADYELDVVPTVRALVSRAQSPVRCWSYFSDAVRRAASLRLAAPNPIEPAEPARVVALPARRGDRVSITEAAIAYLEQRP